MQHSRISRLSSGALGAAALALVLGCAPLEEPEGDAAAQFRSGWSTPANGGLTGALYTPATDGVVGEGRSLLVVLHGCSQTYANLQTHGRWIDTAEEHGMVISLPGVAGGGVYFGCWDYYGGSHSRNSGDAADLLAHVNALLADPALGIDPDQVYIAGLSSGGGMAMVMACLAPDVFAGVGIAAGPTVGTSAFQISSVSTNAGAAQSTCEALAGAQAGHFDTQLAAVISGTSDYTVAQGYATLNAQVFANVYADAAGTGALGSAALTVAELPGYQPAGTGSVRLDAEGTRVALISAQGMGHAWPAGSGPGGEISFVARQGVDFAAYLAELFTANNRRVEPGSGSGGGSSAGGTTSGGDTDGGSTDGGSSTGGSSGGGETSGGETTGEDSSGGETTGDDPSGGDTTGEDPSGGDDGAGADEGGVEEPCEPWLSAVSATITGHFSRFKSYPGGYGVADLTYVALFSMYGMSTPFTLYLGTDGNWYHDPANLPGAGCGA